MTISVNEYSSGLPQFNYVPTNYDVELELAVAKKKQDNYDRVLNTVRGLQSQALNIQMLNQEGKERLDSYNRELNEQLSGDLGDLSQAEVQNRVAGFFQKLAGDHQLVKASRLSSEYQNQLDMIESFKQSGRKDRGYNSINETVFMEWDGGLYDFARSSLNKVTDPGFNPTKYTPFKELDTKVLNIAKSLHPDTVIREGGGSEGYLLHKELTEVSPEKIREMMLSQFDQEDLEQLDVMAKYEVIKHRKLNSLTDFYDKYNTFSEQEISRTQSKAKELEQQANYYDQLILSKDTTDDKKAEYQTIVTQLRNNATLYKNRAFDLTNSKKAYSDFEKLSNDELLEKAKEIQWHNKINGLSSALSWKKDVQTLKPDTVWMFNKKMDVMQWQERLRAETKLTASKLSKSKESEAPVFTGPIDSVKNTQSFYDSFKTLVTQQEQMSKQTNRVITSPNFDGRQLMNDQFLQQNKDNYEVKMWDIFSREHPNLAIVNGLPQIEAFKLWVKDQEQNPSYSTSQVVEGQNRNEIVSDWLDIQVSNINKLTRESSNEYDLMQGYPMYKQDGTPLSKEEFNSGTPAYLGVPSNTDKTQFRLVKLDDAMDEARTYTDNYASYLESGQTIGGLPGTPTQTKPQSYITDDRGLYERLLNLKKIKEQTNTQLEQQLIGQLPQIFQMPLVEAVNDEAKLIYVPDVVSAAKNSNEGKDVGQFAISPKDIAFMRPPTSGQWGQFSLSPEVSKTYGEMGWRLPDAADPTKTVLIQPGVSYAFKTDKPYMNYDVLFNEIVKDIPYKDKYKGFTTSISRSKLDGSFTVSISDSNGNPVVNPKTTNSVSDIYRLIQVSRQQIDFELNKKK